MNERVEEIRVKCAALAYVDGPTYEDMDTLLAHIATLTAENEQLKENISTLEDANDELREVKRPGRIRELVAENERLRAKLEGAKKFGDIQLAEKRALEAALRGMLICDDRCKRPQCVQARAALPEPTPPVCSNPAHWDEPHPCPMCRATPPAGGQG